MSSGLSNKLIGQVGEFLVCAELGRRELIATPFSGNVPGFDVIATNAVMRSVPLQVKTANGRAWQFAADKLLHIEFNPTTGVQVVKGVRDGTYPDLIYVFVLLGQEGRRDRFFILPKKSFLDVALAHYTAYLARHGGVRPRKPETMHMALRAEDFAPFENRWATIESALASRA